MTGTFADLLIIGKCEPCKGTGVYHYCKDGNSTRTRFTCYRCGGKGYQTRDDQRRNLGYDRFAAGRPKVVA